MSIFNEYLTGYERELAIEEATFDTEFSKLFTMLEMVELQYEQMVKDAELKVLTESGTYDDFEYLISEAEQEAGKQQKGIFASIIAAIGRLFSAIGEKISKIIGHKGDDNAEVEVPSGTQEKHNAIVECINKVKEGANKLGNNDWSGALDIFNAIKIPALITAGGAVGGVVLMKTGTLKKMSNTVSTSFNNLKTSLTNIQKKAEEGNTIADKIKANAISVGLKIVEGIGKVVLNFTGFISSTIEKGKEVVSSKIDKVKKVLKGKKDDKNPDNNSSQDENPQQNSSGTENNTPAEPTVILSTNHNNKPCRLWSNGKWEMKDKNTKKWVEMQNVPPALAKLAEGNITNESTIDDIMSILGDALIIEKTEDGFNITDSEMMESASSSIFGYSLDNEDVYQESVDEFDRELDELAKIFAEL